MKIKILLILLLSICSFINSVGQNKQKLDSLLNDYKNAKHDTTRIKLFLKIGEIYQNTNHDSSLLYYNKALEMTESSSQDREKSDVLKKYKTLKVSSLYYIGVLQFTLGNFDKAIEYYLKALKINIELDDKNTMAVFYKNIGIVYHHQGIYDKAIEHYLKSLKIAEEIGDKKGISDCYICIGIVHRSQDNYANAIEYYLKSVKIKEELGDKYGMSACYNNIGTIHQHEGSLFVERNDTLNANLAYNKAIKYYLKAIKINKEIGHKQWLSNNYGNIGSIYLDRCFYDKAKEYFLQSLKIFEELGDINSIARIYADLANLYTKIAYCSAEKRVGSMEYNLKQAIEFGNKAITLSREIKALPIENQTADILRIVYKGLKNTAKALEYAEIYISTRDSMFGEEKTEALAEMETRYKAEKRQLQIEKQQVEISRQLVVSSRQRVIILFVVGGLFLVLFFSVFMIRLFLQKKKANIIIAEKNQNLERANAEITAQRDEIAVQRDLVTIQKEHIEEQKKEITDSINYAKRIQQAILPDFSKGFTFGKGESFIDHFVLFKPKDIVSGDFYWSAQVNEWLIVAAVDCTGHGVPGAFMSMLGVSFLNEIVRKKEVTNAAMVLNHLRTSIIEALKQTGEEGTQKDMPSLASAVKDGMDMSLVAINLTPTLLQAERGEEPRSLPSSLGEGSGVRLQCQWAGANNPLYLIQAVVSQPIELKEIKPDKMPVAVHAYMNPFTNHDIQLNKGDRLYLFSDGYPDQFGGSKGKKFLYKRFKELLVQTSPGMSQQIKSMKEQGEQIEKALDEWMTGFGKHYEQIDDITVVGLKI